ncbi:MAG: hypothetical protein E6I65_12320 [Chloroflexi bacterium]|nr:MAG: hypothetical protein E6I65_12320 [Chloroflexota bacterium]
MSFWNGNKWVGDTPPATKPESRVKRLAAAALEASLITALTFGLIAGTTFAAKGGAGARGGGGTTGGGTISGPIMVTDVNGDGLANWGDQVTFTVVTGASYPSLQVACAQNGTWVYSQTVGFYPTYFGDRFFTLKSYWWAGGAADCTAVLTTTSRNGSTNTLATRSFSVGG